MKKLIYLLPLFFLFSCGPSQEETAKKNEQELAQKTKELDDYKKSKEYQEYKKNHPDTIIFSKEIRDLAEEKLVKEKNTYYQKRIISPYDNGLILYQFDGCEYVGNISKSSSDYITHKGNCKFCHKRDSLMMVSIIRTLVPDIVRRNSHH